MKVLTMMRELEKRATNLETKVDRRLLGVVTPNRLFYSIWWSNRDSSPQAMIGIHGNSEIDALRNYASVNNLYDYGWMIEATVSGGVMLRRYSDDGNCTGEIFAEVSPVNQFRGN